MVLAVNTARIKVLEDGRLDMAPAELLQLLRELVNPTNRYDQAVGQTAFKTMRMPSEDGMGILHIIALWPVRMFDLNEALELVVKQLMAVGSAA